MIGIGTLIYGLHSGIFKEEAVDEDKRIEAFGCDWVVARGIESGEVYFASGDGILSVIEGVLEL